MKWCIPGVVLIVGIVNICAIAQPVPKNAVQVTVCDIVNNPLQFKGKLVRVRAQFFDDLQGQFWMNEASIQFDKVCHFVPAKFKAGTGPGGSTGFGTFIGRVVSDPAGLSFDVSGGRGRRSRVMLLVEQQSDLYGLRDYNGPVPILHLYDNQTGSFVRPQ